jgi:hypothetical protein
MQSENSSLYFQYKIATIYIELHLLRRTRDVRAKPLCVYYR